MALELPRAACCRQKPVRAFPLLQLCCKLCLRCSLLQVLRDLPLLWHPSGGTKAAGCPCFASVRQQAVRALPLLQLVAGCCLQAVRVLPLLRALLRHQVFHSVAAAGCPRFASPCCDELSFILFKRRLLSCSRSSLEAANCPGFASVASAATEGLAACRT
jgi:hypothetical protein